MAWLEIHQTLPTHRKTLGAADLLDMEPVHFMGHIISFWLWALDNVPDGNLDGISPRMIARAAEWHKDPNTFLEALLSVGFIDKPDAGLVIHDWHDYAGKLIERRIAERERSRRRREQKRQNIKRETIQKQPQDDRRSTAQQPLAQYSTVQYSTNKDICAPSSAPKDVPEGDKQKPRKPFRSLAQEKRFDEFWSHYPKKRSKGQAEKTWVKLSPDDELLQTILNSLKHAIQSPDWQKDGGQFIPYPSTWLNAKGWEDEFKADVPASESSNDGPNYYFYHDRVGESDAVD